MRRMSAAIAGGVFFVIAAMGSCYLPRDYPDPVPDAGVELIDGTKVDGMQACLDWCTLSKQLCAGPSAETDCADYCERQFGNATALCKNELSAMYACYQQGVESPGDGGDPCLPLCQVYQQAVVGCISQNGCISGESTCFHSGLNGVECYCENRCRTRQYISICWPSGMTTFTCECRDGADILGTCDSGTELFCDPDLWKGCCNEYFKL